jgi:hypothetical protein
MADAKISALTMVSAPELQDLLPLVDVNDATDAATGTTKQSLLSYLLAMAGMPFQGRLSLESGVAVSSTDQVAKSTLYLLPWHGNRLTLPTISGSDLRWVMLKVNTVGFPLSGLTSGKPYDVFCFTTTATPSSTNTTTDIITFGSAQGWATGSNVTVTTTGGGLTAGTAYFWNAASSTTGSFHNTIADALTASNKINLTANITQAVTGVSLELLAWSSDVARSTLILTIDGVWYKNGDTTRRLVGTIYTTGTNTTEDSEANRYVSNAIAYNQVPRRLHRCPKYTNDSANTSYTFTTNTFAEANGSGNGRVNFVHSMPGMNCNMFASVICLTSATGGANAGLGFDGITDIRAMGQTNTVSYLQAFGLMSGYSGDTPGKHSWVLCGYSQAGTATFFSDGANTVGGGTADYKDTYLEGWLNT